MSAQWFAWGKQYGNKAFRRGSQRKKPIANQSHGKRRASFESLERRELLNVAPLSDDAEWLAPLAELAGSPHAPVEAFVATPLLESSAVPFPESMTAINPLGSLVYEATTSDTVSEVGDLDHFVLELDPCQQVSVAVRPGDGLQPYAELHGPGGELLGSGTASAPGETVVIQAVDTGEGGTFTVTVGGAAESCGDYTLRANLNALFEAEPNDTRVTAQDLDDAFLTLSPSADRVAVLGSVGATANSDYYAFSLAAGETVNLVITSLGPGFTAGYLHDSTGYSIKPAKAVGGGVSVANYRAAVAGTYYAMVTGLAGTAYDLVVARGATIDLEANETSDGAQMLDGVQAVLGYSGVDDEDWHALSLAAGQEVLLGTHTPADGGGHFENRLDPHIEIFSPDNTLIAEGTCEADGRNESIAYTAAAGGTYRVRVTAEGTTSGEYTLTAEVSTLIRGTLYFDEDGDGTRDEDEPPRVGETVYLDLDGDASWDSADEPSAVTDAVGVYRFTGIDPGQYSVRLVTPDGFVQSHPQSTDRLFAVSSLAPNGLILELDPLTGMAVNLFPTPANAPMSAMGLAYDGASLYLLASPYSSTLSYTTLYELDPDNGSVLREARINGALHEGLAVSGGWIYVLNSISDRLMVIDPATLTQVHAIDLRAVNPGFDFYGGLGEIAGPNALIATLSGTGNDLVLLDPATGQVIGTPIPARADAYDVGVTTIGSEIFVAYSDKKIRVFDRAGTLLRTMHQTNVAHGLAGATGTSAFCVVLTADGNAAIDLDFGLQPALGTIGGVYYTDLDRDGVHDPAEPPLAGATIYLDTDGNGRHDAGEPTAVTGAAGDYAFTGLAAGDYTVRAGSVDGQTQSQPRTAADRLFASNPASGRICEIRPGDGTVTGAFAAPVSRAAVQGLAFDGTWLWSVSAGDPTLRKLDPDTGAELVAVALPRGREYVGAACLGNLVYVFDAADMEILVVDPARDQLVRTLELDELNPWIGSSAGLGIGELHQPDRLLVAATKELLLVDPQSGLVTGSIPYNVYSVCGVTSVGDEIFVSTSSGQPIQVYHRDGTFLRTIPNPGSSLAPALAGCTGDDGAYHVALRPGQRVDGFDFGGRTDGTEIQGVLFDDRDGDGVRDAAEPPWAGRTAFLDANDNGQFDSGETSATTDAFGRYVFTGLAEGVYTVRQVVPADYRQTLTSTSGRLFSIQGAEIAELDRYTGTAIRTFPAPGPTIGDPHGLAFDGKWIYYVGPDCVLYQLDPDFGTLLRQTALPGAKYAGLAAMGESLYLLDPANKVLVQVDPGSGEVLATRTVTYPGYSSFGLLGGLGELASESALLVPLWFPDNGDLGILDPTTGEIIGTIGTGASFNDGLATIGEEIFVGHANQVGVYDAGGTLRRWLSTELVNSSLAGGLGSDGYRLCIGVGDLRMGLDFGSQYLYAEIHGTKYSDQDGDGCRDSGEPPLPGATVYLDLDDDGVFDPEEPSQVTGADGSYAFTRLTPGDYVVREIVAAESRQTFPSAQRNMLFSMDNGKVVELDAATGATLRQFSVPGGTAWSQQSLAYDGRSLFYVNDDYDILYQLNPNTGAVVRETSLPDDWYDGLAVLDGCVYVMNSNADRLLQIDGATGAVAVTRTITYPDTLFIAWRGGLTAIGDAGLLLAPVIGASGGSFALIDPNSGAVIGTIDTGVSTPVFSVTAIGQEILVGHSDAIRVFDRSGSLLRELDCGFIAYNLAGQTFDGAHRVTVGASQVRRALDFGNKPLPRADAGGPYAAAVGRAILVDGSASTPHGDGIEYAWDLDGDGIFGETGEAAERGDELGVTPTFDAAGLAGLIGSELTIALRVSDASGDWANDTATIRLLAAPEIIVLLSDYVAENLATGSEVGALSATDADGAEALTFELVAGEGDADNRSFTIAAGRRLLTDEVFDFEAKAAYSIRVRATDADGLWCEAILTVSVVDVDEIAPAVTVNPLTTGDFRPELGGTIDDPLATVKVTVGGTAYSAVNHGDGTWSLPDDVILTPLADGVYDVQATATDAAGNTGSDATTGELVIDTTAPMVTVAALVTNDTTPAVTGTVSDGSLTVVVNGVTYTPGTDLVVNGTNWTLTIPASDALAEGTYDVQVSATDLAGNTGSDATTDELVIDTTAPVVTVAALVTNDTTPTITGTVSDGLLTVVVNGVTYTPGADLVVNGTNWMLTIPPGNALPEGTYDVQASATDQAGNTGSDGTADELVIQTDFTELGVVAQLVREGEDPSAGPKRYRLQPIRQGWLTVEALTPGTQLDLLDSQLSVLTTATTTAFGCRLDWQASSAESYFVRLSGSVANVTLRLTNLVVHQGTTLTVYGTDSADTFTFVPGTTGTATINGVDYAFAPASVQALAFHGGLGADQADLTASGAQETARMAPGSASLSGGAVAFSVDETETINLYSAGGDDAIDLYAGDGLDEFLGKTNFSALAGDWNGTPYSNYAWGFRYVRAHSTPGSGDIARLNGSSGQDTLTASPTLAAFGGTNFSNAAEGFSEVHVFSNAAGGDLATLSDSPDADVYIGRPDVATLYSEVGNPLTYYLRAVAFAEVSVSSSAGADVAVLNGSDSDDTFTHVGPVGTLTGPSAAGTPYVLRTDRFPLTYMVGRAGTNDVVQYDDSALTESFLSDFVYTRWAMVDAGRMVLFRSVRFDHVTATCDGPANTDGSQDTARFEDSRFGDLFTFSPEPQPVARMFNGKHDNRAVGFRQVVALSENGGIDWAELDGSSLADTFETLRDPTTQAPTTAVLRHEGDARAYAVRLLSFEKVYARGGLEDFAFLYDSAAADLLTAQLNLAQLSSTTGPSWKYLVEGFEHVHARSDFSGDGDCVKRIDPLAILDFVLEGDWEV